VASTAVYGNDDLMVEAATPWETLARDAVANVFALGVTDSCLRLDEDLSLMFASQLGPGPIFSIVHFDNLV